MHSPKRKEHVYADVEYMLCSCILLSLTRKCSVIAVVICAENTGSDVQAQELHDREGTRMIRFKNGRLI